MIGGIAELGENLLELCAGQADENSVICRHRPARRRRRIHYKYNRSGCNVSNAIYVEAYYMQCVVYRGADQ